MRENSERNFKRVLFPLQNVRVHKGLMASCGAKNRFKGSTFLKG